jgi:hypothetical protein
MRLAALLLILLAGCDRAPPAADCCLDPKIQSTCARHLYERDGSTIKRNGQCPF